MLDINANEKKFKNKIIFWKNSLKSSFIFFNVKVLFMRLKKVFIIIIFLTNYYI